MLEGSVRKNLSQEMLTQQFEAELKIFRLEQEEISLSLFAGDKECDLRLCWNDGLMSLGEYAQGSCFCWQIPIAWECYTWSSQQNYRKNQQCGSTNEKSTAFQHQKSKMKFRCQVSWCSYGSLSQTSAGSFSLDSRNDYGVLQLSRLSLWKRIFWSNS